MKYSILISVIFIVILIASVGAYFVFFNNTPQEKEFPGDVECGQKYLNICFDRESPAYGCDLEERMCNEDKFKLATILAVMKQRNIVIYGTTWCPHCKTQVDYFGEYKDYMLNEGLLVYCDIEPVDPGCSDITNVPAWKHNGEIVQIGVIDIDQLIDNLDISI